MEPLGVAIIGCGGISEGHADSFSQLASKVKIIGFTDIDLDKAKYRAQQFNAPIVTSDYTELLKRTDVHIISICSPPFHHLPVIKDSLTAGKHVLCEKPVVLNLAELDEVEQMVQKTGLVFGGAFQWRFGTGIQQVKDVHDHGLFGKIVYATSNLFWHRTQEYFNVDWRNTWEKSGGGILFTLACHGLDALIWILGDMYSVSAEMDALKYQIEIEDTGSVILRFKNGALGAINATINSHHQRSHLEIIGTELEAISSDDAYGVAYLPWQFHSVYPDRQKQIQNFFACRNYQFEPASHRRLIRDFVDAIFNRRQPAINVSEVRRSLQVITAIYKSHRTGRKVELPISQNDDFYYNLNPV